MAGRIVTRAAGAVASIGGRARRCFPGHVRNLWQDDTFPAAAGEVKIATFDAFHATGGKPKPATI